MAHTKSAKKRARQSERRRLRNRASRRDLKSHLKTVADTAKGAAGDALKKEVSTAFRKLDQAAAKGVLHRNAAARKKAQLHRLLKSKAAT